MKMPAKTMVAIALFLLLGSLEAEISPENLPSMDNLAALLEDTDRQEVKQATKANKGRIASGLPVRSDSARGATADEIAALLSGGNRNQKIQMKKAIMAERDGFEKVLSEHGFDTRDMGVAFAVSFITLWELASHKELPLETSLSAGSFLVHAMKGVQAKYAALPEQEKAQGYDWLMTTPVAFASLIKGFEKAGRNQEAEQLRKKSGALFKKLFQMPHDAIIITTQGDIEVDAERLIEYNKNATSNADALIEQAMTVEPAQ